MSSASAPEFGMATITGPRRNVNEDVVSAPEAVDPSLLQKKGWLFVIADGVSGYVGAQEASVTAASTVMEEYYQDDSPVAGIALEHAIQAANARLHERGQAVPDSGLRTTVGAVVLQDNELTAANVGDSRVYLLQNRRLRQVSSDHRWVTEQVQRGLISEADAVGHPFSHILTRSLGEKDQVQVDVHRETVRSGDSIVLCTDGLYNAVPGGAIERILNESNTAAAAAQALVDLASQGDAGDDISAIVIRPAAAPPIVPAMTAALSKPTLTLPQTLGLVAGAIVLVILARVAWGWLTTPPAPAPEPTATVRAPVPTLAGLAHDSGAAHGPARHAHGGQRGHRGPRRHAHQARGPHRHGAARRPVVPGRRRRQGGPLGRQHHLRVRHAAHGAAGGPAARPVARRVQGAGGGPEGRLERLPQRVRRQHVVQAHLGRRQVGLDALQQHRVRAIANQTGTKTLRHEDTKARCGGESRTRPFPRSLRETRSA